MIKLKDQSFIIQTIDRLLAKCVVQVVEYCRTNPVYQFISQKLGVMLTNARKAPVILHTLECYKDVSGDNECKGTESAIFTYYTPNPKEIKRKWGWKLTAIFFHNLHDGPLTNGREFSWPS